MRGWKPITHGHCVKGTLSLTYQSWAAMKGRCRLKTTNSYEDYGGRGITVCDRWVKFENFLADMGERPSRSHSLERIDNDGHYEPSNCVWATAKQQANHRRNNVYVLCKGERLTASNAARRLGIGIDTLSKRLKNINDPTVDIASIKWKVRLILTPALIDEVRTSRLNIAQAARSFDLSESEIRRIRQGKRKANTCFA